MKNSLYKRVIIWIMTAVLVFCGITIIAAAEEPTTGTAPKPIFGGVAVLNDIAQISESYKTTEGKTLDPTTVAPDTAVILVVKAKFGNEVTEIPDSFVYNLPGKVKTAEGGSDSNLAWTVSGSQLTFTWKDTNRKKESFETEIPVTLSGLYDLYNMAVVKINNKETWYRLGKTTIDIAVPYTQYKSGMEYTAEDYDFTNTVLTVNNIPYVYQAEVTDKPAAPYYTVEFRGLEGSTRIGGMDGSNPRWLIGAPYTKYDDNNSTGGYHRNYTLVLHDGPIEQPLFNFLNINQKYYRLKKTSVIAYPVRSIGAGVHMTEDQYILPAEYDFTNLILDVGGELYRYSDKELTGDYESYYTVSVETPMLAKAKMHNTASWYFDENGWLDGSKETFTAEELKSNDLWGFHRDYAVKLHKGKPVNLEESAEDLSITISSDWPEGKIAFVGAKITLTAQLSEGFQNKTYTLQWQYTTDGNNWTDQPGANELTYTYTLDEVTATYTWRIVAKGVKNKE